jgi:hypothetical protein
MTIKWPVRNSRVIPTAANSIVITVSMAGKTVATSGPIARPAKAGTSTWSTPSLPQGTYQLAATAFPNTDGTGTAQAAGTGALTITPNRNTQASVTMGSTVTSITTSVTNLLGRPNFTFPVTVTTKDADGNVVLVADSDIKWQISNQGVVQVATGGVNATFKGLTRGSTTVTATFTGVESTLGQSPISTPALSCSVGINTNSQGPPWPLHYATSMWGSATSSAPAASGQSSILTVPPGFNAYVVEADGALIGDGPVGLDGIYVQAVNPDGTMRWAYTQAPRYASFIELGPDGAVYFGEPNDIRVLNPEDGSTIAVYPTNHFASYFLAPDGSIYWATIDNEGSTVSLSCSNANGAVKWTIPFPDGAPLSVGPDGTVYGQMVTNDLGQTSIVAINPDGSTKWTTKPVSFDFSHAIYSPSGKLFCIPGSLPSYNMDPPTNNQLMILDSATGKTIATQDWSNYAVNGDTDDGAADGSQTACLDSQDNLYVMALSNLDNGDPVTLSVLLENTQTQHTLMGPFTTGQRTWLSAAAGGNVLYCGTQNGESGQFTAYDTNWNTLWSVPYQAAPNSELLETYTTPMIGSDGTVYLHISTESYLKILGGASSSVTTTRSKR